MNEDKTNTLKEPIVTQAPKMKTNTTKAILAMNGYAITNFVYMVLSKILMERHGVNAIDLMLVRSMVSFTHSFTHMKLAGLEFIGDELRDKKTFRTLFLRSITGTIGFAGLVFAIARIPMGFV